MTFFDNQDHSCAIQDSLGRWLVLAVRPFLRQFLPGSLELLQVPAGVAVVSEEGSGFQIFYEVLVWPGF